MSDKELPLLPNNDAADKGELQLPKERCVGNMRFAALDYQEEHAEKQSHVGGTASATKPMPDFSSTREERRTAADVQTPNTLSWVLGIMSLLLFLVSSGLLLANYWHELPMMVRVISLVVVPALLWLFYIIGYHKGYRSSELAALFSVISWLDAVIIYQLCIQQLPWWITSSILTLGLLLIPLIKPWKSAVSALFIAGFVQFVMMGLAMQQAVTYGEWVVIATSALATLMLWSHIGAWCSLTSRRQYRPYAILSPVAQCLFLFALVGMLVYPQHTLPAGLLLEASSWVDWVTVLAIWVVVMLPCLPMQRHFAEICNHPNISNSFLLYWATSIITVPLGLLLVANVNTLVVLPLVLLNMISISYYGTEYSVTRFVILGCIGIFLSLVSIPIHLQTGLLVSAAIFMGFSVVFYITMACLNARVRARITRRREEAAIMREVEQERKNMKEYHEKERFSIDLPNKD